MVTWVVSAVLAGCFGPGAGQGSRAEAGRRAATPIIAALEKYRHERGHYPAQRDELFPHYVSGPRAFETSDHGKHITIGYQREKDGTYRVGFAYVSGFPGGMNECWYCSRTGRWESAGYY